MAVLSNSTNTCKACKQELPIDMFYRGKNRYGTIYASNYCKGCTKAKTIENKAKALDDPVEAERRKLWRREHKRKLRRKLGWRTLEQKALDKAARLEAAEVKRLAGQQERAFKACEPIAHVKRWRDVIRAREAYRVKAKDPAYKAKVASRKRARLASCPEAKARANAYMRGWLKTDKGRQLHARSKAKVLATPKGRLDKLMSKYMRECLGAAKKGRSWRAILGYGPSELKVHLERQFVKGMGWHNRHLWHIDHRIPRASFKYVSPNDEAFKACWSLANLQPLWAEDNMKKGCRIECLV